ESVGHGVGDSAWRGDDRRLTCAQRAQRVGVDVWLVKQHDLDLGYVADGRHLVVLEIGVEHYAGARIHHAPLGEGEAETLDDAALDLAAKGQRVDDAAAVVDRDDT